MTYTAKEESVQEGRPHFLYLFDDGVTKTRFTSEPNDVQADPEISGSDKTWFASSISHGKIEQTGNVEKSAVEMTFPISGSFAQSLLVPIGARIISVTVWRRHWDDVDNQFRVVWKGRVVGTKSKGKLVHASVESIFTSLRRPGCRVRYQRTCRHALYFGGCGLNREDFEVPATITAINNMTLTLTLPTSSVSGFPNDFLGGIVNFNGRFGFIEAQSGNDVTLISMIEGLQEEFDISGDVDILIAPGCRLTLDYCTDRFDNFLNFGGFPYMSNKNPFTTSIV